MLSKPDIPSAMGLIPLTQVRLVIGGKAPPCAAAFPKSKFKLRTTG